MLGALKNVTVWLFGEVRTYIICNCPFADVFERAYIMVCECATCEFGQLEKKT